jgi:EAL domain-containing protein (putative c-di-GMP-specific phosphodiesterase class I)/predicted  nucleic acid-binding Zn-ribbon protein
MEQESAGYPFGDGDTTADNGGGTDATLGAPRAIDDIRKVAEAFNAAFNELLNESVIARRQLDERAGRIADLDEALRRTSSALQDEVERYGQLERAAAGEADALRRELQEFGAERARLQEQVELLQETIAARDTALSGQAARLEQMAGDLEARTETAQSEREAHAREVAALGEQLDGLRGQLADTGQQLAQGEARTAELLQELETRNQELGARNGELEAVQARNAVLEQEMHEVVVARDEAVNALQSMSDALRDLEAHATNLENLNNALHDSAVSEQNRSRKTIQLRDTEIQALRRRLEQSGQGEDDTGRLQEELQQLQIRLVEAENDLRTLSGVQNALQQAEQALADREAQDVAAALEHDELLQLRDEIDGLRQQVAGMDGLLTSLEAMQTENAGLRSDLQAAREQLAGTHDQQQVEELQAEIAGLQQRLAVSEQALGEMLRPEPTAETAGAAVPTGDDATNTGQSGAFHAPVAVSQTALPAVDEGMDAPEPDADESWEDIPGSTASADETAFPDTGTEVSVQPEVPAGSTEPAVFGNEADIVSSVLRGHRMKDLYQPISTLRGDTSGFYEILVRVTGEDGNVISAASFFAMAQRCGRAFETDCYIIESAMKELSRDRSGSVSLFIKLSPDSVANEELGMRVLKLVKQYKVNPGRLVFEVTENNLRMNLKSVSALTRALHSIGCKVAVEHYTNSTDLQHLKHIHADFLKIDASLVRAIGEDDSKLGIIREIVDVARIQGCKTIAEQVESPYSLTRLWSLGVDYAQGFFIQEPGTERGYDFDGNGVGGNRSGDGGKAIFTY